MGLILPRKTSAMAPASRPSVLPSASTWYQRRFISLTLGKVVFTILPPIFNRVNCSDQIGQVQAAGGNVGDRVRQAAVVGEGMELQAALDAEQRALVHVTAGQFRLLAPHLDGEPVGGDLPLGAALLRTVNTKGENCLDLAAL